MVLERDLVKKRKRWLIREGLNWQVWWQRLQFLEYVDRGLSVPKEVAWTSVLEAGEDVPRRVGF